jgi:hypothetical protein
MKLNPGLPWQNLHSTRKMTLFSTKLDLDLRKRLTSAILGTKLLYASTWIPDSRLETPGKFLNVVLKRDGEDQLDDSVGNEAVLQRVMEERNIQSTVQRRKAKWTGHILRKSCLLKHVMEGKIDIKI